MKIKRVILENVRCFEHRKIDIPSERCVLVGRNGSGKSTILKAITNVYIAMMGLMDESEYSDCMLQQQDIRYGEDVLSVIVDFELNEDEKQVMQDAIFRIKIAYNKLGKIFFIYPDEFSESEEHRREYTLKWEMFKELLMTANVIYFDAYRFMSKNNPKGPVIADIKKESMPLLQTNINKSGQTTNKVMQLKQWLINIDYIRLKSNENKYELLYNHLTKAFDLLLHPLEYKGIDQEGNIFFYDNDNKIPVEIDSLSDGFKSVFQILVGIFKMFFENAAEEELFYMKDGVVLVDEIDCHIHPRWQKNMLSSFKELFPNCQFIVTTHSPYIVESVNDYEIVRIGEKPIE